MGEIHQAAGDSYRAKAYVEKADTYYDQQKQKIADTKCLAIMEGFPIPMWNYRDGAVRRIEEALKPAPPAPPIKPGNGGSSQVPAPEPKKYKHIFRQSLLKEARLESDAEIDAYVDKLRDQLKTLLKGSDGIDLK